MVAAKTWFRKVFPKGSPARKAAGVLLIIVGFLALITPFSPGSWLMFVGLGFLGVRLAFWERFKLWLKETYAVWKQK